MGRVISSGVALVDGVDGVDLVNGVDLVDWVEELWRGVLSWVADCGS